MDTSDFDSIFGSDPDATYSRQSLETIHKNRTHLGGDLFIDRLFKLIKLDSAQKLYPPRTPKDFRELFKEIVTSSRPLHDQQSLIYYILRDLQIRTRHAARFVQQVSLPEQFRIFMDGLWFLDHLKYEQAVECLTEPILTPTFPEEILEVLLRHAPPKSNLGLAYYHAVSPSFSSWKVMDLLVNAMCRASLTETFFTSRTYDQSRRQHIFEHLIAFVHQMEAGPARARAGVELVGLPLDHTEEQWLEDYLLHGQGKSLQGSLDTVIMRQMAMGRAEEAQRLAGYADGGKIDGLDWQLLTHSVQP